MAQAISNMDRKITFGCFVNFSWWENLIGNASDKATNNTPFGRQYGLLVSLKFCVLVFENSDARLNYLFKLRERLWGLLKIYLFEQLI